MNGIHQIESLEHRTLLAATLVHDAGPGAYNGVPRELTTFDGELYYVVAYRPASTGSGVFGYLWRTDGTPGSVEQVGPAPLKGLTPGTPTDLQGWQENLQFYAGTWGVNVAGDRLWFYNVVHDGGTNMLRVSLNSIDANGNERSYDLGRVNLSSRQNVNDIQNFQGRMYFYRDGDWSTGNPADRLGYWWTVNDAGELVSTGVTDPNAFIGDGPDRATSATLGDRRFFAHEAPSRIDYGRELYVEPVAPGAGSETGVASRDVLRGRVQSSAFFGAASRDVRSTAVDDSIEDMLM
jgi:hypothetical protein